MESYWEDITPEKAAEYLRGNAARRSVSQSVVSGYARDMAAGHWLPTHQGIAFDEQDVLIDGQHRMTAVVRSGKTIRFWVTRGVGRENFGVLDTGRVRTLANLFEIEGQGKDATQLAAVGRRVTLWLAGEPWNKKFIPTRSEVAKTVEEHPELVEAAKFAHGWPPRRTIAPAVAGFCWWLFGTIDSDEANYFMDHLRTGEALETGDPILTLRERLFHDRTLPQRTSRTLLNRPTEIQTALTIMAWNHYRRRNKLQRLQLPNPMSNEVFPRPI